MRRIILASSSPVRQAMLKQVRLPFEVQKAQIDEEMLRSAMRAEKVKPRDMADQLAEFKASRVAAKKPDALVLGADQILEFDGEALGKSSSAAEAEDLLKRLQGKRHMLHTAAVIFENARPVWRHVATVRMMMRPLSDGVIADYIDRNWEDVSYCVGAYKIESEGARLFSKIDGDYFAILGLPLLDIVSYLSLRGDIDT